MTDQPEAFENGSTNVFADLGFPDPDTHLLKAQLVAQIADALAERKVTQTAAAALTGVSQPDISRLLKGQFRDISIEKLMRMLTRLGCEVDIVVRPAGQPARASTIHLVEPVAA